MNAAVDVEGQIAGAASGSRHVTVFLVRHEVPARTGNRRNVFSVKMGMAGVAVIRKCPEDEREASRHVDLFGITGGVRGRIVWQRRILVNTELVAKLLTRAVVVKCPRSPSDARDRRR